MIFAEWIDTMGQILFCDEIFCKTVNKEIGVYKEKCYIHNIFTINYSWLVIIGYNLNLSLKLIFFPYQEQLVT